MLEGVVARPPAPPVLAVEEAEDLGGAVLAEGAGTTGYGITNVPDSNFRSGGP